MTAERRARQDGANLIKGWFASVRVVGHTPDKIHNVSPKHTALAPCDGGARRQHLVGPSRRSHGDRKRCPPPQKHHQLRTFAHPLLLRDEPQT